MKKILITNAVVIIFGFLLLTNCSVEEEKLTTEKLEILAKSWGLMKYHHPEIGTGRKNWDSLFIAHFPLITAANTKQQFNQELKKLLESAGNLRFRRKPLGCDSLKTESQVDFNWLDSNYLLDDNRAHLKSILNNKGIYRNKYVSDSVGNRSLGYARFYEDPMVDANLEHEVIRLLGLFRYWNIIEYYFPYKDLIDKDWSDVLTEYIPQFRSASNKEDYYECLLRLSTEINDGHANIPYHPELRKKFFGNYTVPFTVKILENKLVVTSIKSDSLAQIAEIKIGDVIEEIDGESYKQRITFLSSYVPEPNKAFQNSEISRYILRGNTDSLHLKIDRNSKIIQRKIHRYTFSDLRSFRDKKQIAPWQIIEDNIGYANMGKLNNEHLQGFFNAIKNTKGLILDFRSYPNWGILYDFLGHFYTNIDPFVSLKSQCLNQPGTYYWHSGKNELTNIELKTYQYEKPIIILVNENTLSFGEYFVMALQVLDNVSVVGSQTAGEDGNQVGIDMPGEMKMFMSSLGIYYPNGDISQRNGVKIDEEIEQTIDDVKSGIDSAINYAVLKLSW